MNTKDRRAIVTNILQGNPPRDKRGRIDWQKLFEQDRKLCESLGADTLRGQNRLNSVATSIRASLRKGKSNSKKWSAAQRANFNRTWAAKKAAKNGVGFPVLKPEHVKATPAIRMRFCPQCGCDLGAYLAASTLF